MGATENELKQEAEQQRYRMGETLDAIGDRLSPERIIDRRKAAFGQRVRIVRESVMGSPGYDEPVTQRLRGQASDAMHTATETMQSAGERVQNAPSAIADQARGNPLAAGMIAFGFGVLLASVFPKSRTEQRLVSEAKPQLRQAAEELKDAGRDVASGAKDRARAAADEVKTAATEASSNVRDQAEQSADRIQEQSR